MSKASEYAALAIAQNGTPTFRADNRTAARVTIIASGPGLVLHSRCLEVADALRLADWIYDMFGEPENTVNSLP